MIAVLLGNNAVCNFKSVAFVLHFISPQCFLSRVLSLDVSQQQIEIQVQTEQGLHFSRSFSSFSYVPCVTFVLVHLLNCPA